jgi:tetratricopeptide (TPR) repeat protein
VEEPAYTALAVGRALAAIGEWELAAEAFRRATMARPDWAEAWAFLGEAQQRLDPGVHTDNLALQYLEKALSLQPASIAANVFMALYWQRHSHQDTALEYMHKAAAAEPDNPVLQAEIGHFLAELGDLPAALQFYERATELAPNDPAFWLILSEFSIRHGIQIRQIALPAARQALILAPADPASHDLMGHTLLLLGDYNNAERFLWQAIRLEPDYALAHLHLGLLSLLQGRSSDAIRQLTLATTLAPETPTAEQARRLLRRYFPFSDGF